MSRPELPALAIVAALLFSTAIPAAAAPEGFYHPEAGRPELLRFQPADYRGNSQVWTMIERPDGTRLFGLYGGVTEFDGARWETLAGSLGSFRGFATTPDGRTYFTASADLGWVGRTPEGALELHSIASLLPAEWGPPGPFAELVVHQGKLHVSTTKGVARWDGAKFDRFWPLPGTTTARLAGNDSHLWFRRMGQPELYELRGDAWEKIVDDPALKGKPVHFVVPAADGSPILGVETMGLRRLGTDRLTVAWPTVADPVLAQAQLYAGCPLPDGSIAIGTFSDGLVLVSGDGRKARQVTMRDGLPSNLVQGVALDSTRRLWICTYNGIAALEWPPAYTLFDQRDGVDASMVRSMERQGGRIHLGGSGGIQMIEPRPADSLASPVVKRVAALQTSNTAPVPHSTGLIHGAVRGLLQFRDGKPHIVLSLEDNVVFLQVSAKNPDRIFIAGQKGLASALYDGTKWTFEGYAKGSPTFTQFVETDSGNFLARTIAGDGLRLDVPRLASGAPDWSATTIVPFKSIPGWGKDQPPEWSVVRAPHGIVAFTSQGVLRYDEPRGRFEPDATFDRRFTPQGTLFTLLDGPEGIWGVVFPEGRRPGGRNAMGRFVFQPDGTSRWVPLREDMSRTLGALAAHDVRRDTDNPGVFWLRGLSSVLRLDFPLLETPPPPSQPILRRVRRGDRFVALPAADQTLDFAWGKEAVLLQFAAPRSDPGQARFEYRLRGWNESWSAPVATAEAAFTGLGPGDYVFEVRERDAQGRIGPALQVGFIVQRPWWQTPWAWSAYAAVALLGIFGVFRWRTAALESRRRQLEALVTERTNQLATARDQAEAASKAKSTFLAHMSHELRTPLNGIIGYTQVLLKDSGVAGRQRERVNIVHASGQHLLRMINEVLDFSKIEAGKIERQDAPFDPAQLLRELIVAHEAAASARGLAFRCEVPADLPPRLTGDAQKLRQILDNLLSNAVKFTRQGEVSLSLALVGRDTWRFAIQDTGVGLSADDRARLFQPFEQARQGRPAEPGTGLGLAITQRLVHLLGGKLAVDSAPGQGSCFSFTLQLPPAVDHGRGPVLGPIVGYSGPRRRVIVVDDTPINRALLTDLLTPLGFSVREFASAEEMLSAPATELSADLAFLDLKMPGIDGLELARRLRARPDTGMLPLVMTSASVLTFDRAAAARAGCHEFLPKPFSDQQLEEILTRTLPLAWLRATPVAPLAPTSAPLPAALAAELLALADSGDIAALRRAVDSARRQQPENALLASVEQALADYQLERARQLLAGAI